MQQKIWKWISLISILIAIVKIVFPSIGSEAQTVTQIENKPLDPGIAEHILQTSIQITMLKQVSEKIEDQDGADSYGGMQQKVFRGSSGLGTLVSHGEETLLISHDHWSSFNNNTIPDKVLFHDAKGSLLLEMSGTDLLALVLFHDGGTLILKAPNKLAARTFVTADMGSFENLTPGDIVYVVHHSAEQEEQLSIVAAELLEQEMKNGVSVLSLRSLNGQSIEPGDSGGGIWFNGKLAGNMWMTVRKGHQYLWESEPHDINATGLSIAVGLTVELIDLVETLLLVQLPPSLESAGQS